MRSHRVVLTPRIPDSAIAEWVAALQVNESVEHVDLLCSGDFRPSTCRWQVLLKAVLGLPNLKSFQMRGCSTASLYNTKEHGIPISAFSSISSPHLASFSLAQLVLTCESPSDFQDFASAMKGRNELQEFQLISVGLQTRQNQQQQQQQQEDLTTFALQPLLKNLSELPRLENLEVSGTFTPLGVLQQVPHGLFQSKSLKRLSVSDFIFPETALPSSCSDLSKNSTLKELAISGNLTHKVAPGLTRLLGQNKTLEAIALRVDHFDDESCNQELVKAIGSSQLKVVSLCSFFGGDLSPVSRTAFARMVESNYCLEFLYVPCPFTDAAFWEPVRLYLGLNAAGRRQVYENQRPLSNNPVVVQEKQDEKDHGISRSFYSMACKNATRPVSPDPATTSTASNKDDAVSPASKRHQQMVEVARRTTNKKQRLDLPTQGLSSMLIR